MLSRYKALRRRTGLKNTGRMRENVNGMYGYEPRYYQQEDDVLLEEIERLKEQSAELREALNNRIQQSQKLQEMLDKKEDEINEVDKRISVGFGKTLGWLNDLEENLSGQIDGFREENGNELTEVKDAIEESADGLQLSLDSIKCEIRDLQKMTDDSKQLLEKIVSMLEEKADKQSVSLLRKKNSILQAFVVADSVGIIIVIAALVYMLIG